MLPWPRAWRAPCAPPDAGTLPPLKPKPLPLCEVAECLPAFLLLPPPPLSPGVPFEGRAHTATWRLGKPTERAAEASRSKGYRRLRRGTQRMQRRRQAASCLHASRSEG
eukprot:365939-Chlamydomonas_euryale.AAC.16